MENIFKDKLKDFGEMPPAHVWEGIVKKRSPLHIWWYKHVPKFAAVYIISALIIAGGAWLTYGLFNHAESNQPNQISQSQNHPQIKEQPAFRNTPTEKSNTLEIADADKVRSGSMVPANPVAKTTRDEKVKERPEKFDGFVKKWNSTTKEGNSDEDILKGESKPELAERSSADQKNDKSELKTAEGQSKNENVVENDHAQDIAAIETQEDTKSDVTNQEETPMNPGAKPEADKTLHPLHGWHIQVLSGPYWANRVLNGSNTDWIALRNSSEHMKAGWFVNLGVGKSLGKGWELNSGLSLSNRSESLKYTVKRTEEVQTIRETWVTIYHPILPPSSQLIRDTFVTRKEVEQPINGRNNYTVLSVPLYLKYQYYLRYWSFSALAGVSADFKSWNQATVLNQNSELTEFSQISGHQALSGKTMIGLGVGRKIGNHWRGMLEPTLFIPLNPQFSGSGWSQKEMGISINGGIRYEF